MCEKQTGLIKYYLCQYIKGDHAVEMQSAFRILLIGCWLLWFDTFQVSAVYRTMQSIATQWQWAILLIALACVQVICILRPFRLQWGMLVFNSDWIRKHVILVEGFIWTVLFMGVFIGEVRALSTPIYFTFAVNAYRVFFCIKVA